jgi:hypothetical protein
MYAASAKARIAESRKAAEAEDDEPAQPPAPAA